jgi:hypothetical protein
MSKEIDDALDLTPISEYDDYDMEIIDPIKPKEPTDQDNDFTYARENFYNVIEKGTQALEDMLDVAKASEHPRAYEVVSTLMKTLVDANKDLVDLGKKKAELEKKDESNATQVTNNNMFVGSTADLQKLLKDMKDGNN